MKYFYVPSSFSYFCVVHFSSSLNKEGYMTEEQINWLKDNLSIQIKTSTTVSGRWLDVEFCVEGQIVSETSIPIYELQE